MDSKEYSTGEKNTRLRESSLSQNIPTDNPVDLSFGAILKGSAANPLSLFEKKAALINAELDNFGLGRYQICIWFLCGFGYFLDLAWAQGVGLIATAVYQEMNVPDARTGDIWALANAGLAIGAFTWGILVDIIGRKWAFNLTCLITSVFGLLLAAPKFNYGAICGIYFLASFGLGGNIPIDALIAHEFLPQNRRFLVFLLSMWQPIGVVVASAVAYGTAAKWRCEPKLPSCRAVGAGEACCTVASNMGWRYEVIVLGCMTLAVFFLRFVVFRFHESPKFLLSKGREAEAIEVLHKIAKFNKAPPPTLTVEMFREIEETHSMGDYWSFNLAGSFLPIILQQYLIIYSPGVIGAVLALFAVQLPLVGRKWSLVLSAICQGLSMAMYTQVKTTAGYVGLNALEYIMQTFFNAVLYAAAPELFDTAYRGSASGMLSCLGRLAGIVAPFAGASYLASSSSGILWLGAGGIWLSAFVMVFLPVEMKNRQMY